MAASPEIASYKEIVLFLATAGVVVPLFGRARISPVLGFIGVGALLGPYGLGRLSADIAWLRAFTISRPEEFARLAELGVVFLLFTIGIELSWERLRTLRRLVFGFGAAQLVLSTIALAALAMACGISARVALVGGAALALSSTAIVLPILSQQRRLNSPTGRSTLSVLLFQDLAVAPLLFAIAALGTARAGESLLSELLIALGQAALALALIVLAGRLALRPLFQLVAQNRSPELFMAACLLVVIGAALVSAASGLSMALGAFVAGLLLAETEFRRAVEATVEPFKGLLLGLFFLSVGVGLDLSVFARAPALAVGITAVVVALKAAVVVGLGYAFRLPPRVGVESALLLGPAGEFAFVVVGSAATAGLLTGEGAQEVFVVTTLSMLAIPFLARAGRQLGQRIAAANAPAQATAAPPPEEAGRVLIAGYGRVGQLVADMLSRHGVSYLAIDANPALAAAERGAGKPVYYGDTTSPAVLQACGLETARAVVITLDAPSAVQQVVEVVRSARPDVTVVARARDARHASRLYSLGVSDAVPETIEASLQLSEAVLVDIGIAMGPVIASIHERRDEFRRALQAAAGAAQGGQDAARAPGDFRGRRGARRAAS